MQVDVTQWDSTSKMKRAGQPGDTTRPVAVDYTIRLSTREAMEYGAQYPELAELWKPLPEGVEIVVIGKDLATLNAPDLQEVVRLEVERQEIARMGNQS